MTKKLVCRNCFDNFTGNLLGFGLLTDEKDYNFYLENVGNKASDYIRFPNNPVSQKRLENSKIYCLLYSELTPEQFEYLKKNKDKFLFIGKRKVHIDSLGFTHVDWE